MLVNDKMQQGYIYDCVDRHTTRFFKPYSDNKTKSPKF